MSRRICHTGPAPIADARHRSQRHTDAAEQHRSYAVAFGLAADGLSHCIRRSHVSQNLISLTLSDEQLSAVDAALGTLEERPPASQGDEHA